MAQQTIEEAAKKSFNDSEYLYDRPKYTLGFIEGAKYQAERMYTEEDMREAFRGFSSGKSFNEWLEQFKK